MRAWAPPRRSLGQAICVLPLVLAPLLAGTTSRPYILLIAALCGAVGLLAALFTLRQDRQDRETPPAVSWFALFIATALCGTLLQLCPLPPALRALLAPGSDATLRQVLGDLSGYPASFHPLSVDPSATLNEAVRLGGYLALILSLKLCFARRGESAVLLYWVAGVAALVALLGILSCCGVPLPPLLRVPAGATRAKFPAAFVNSNHMAALLGIGAILSAGAALQGSWQRRAVALAGWALCNLALLGTLSRGGITVALVGQAVVALWPRGKGRDPSPRRRVLLLIALPVVLFLIGLSFFEEAQQDLRDRFAATGVADLTTPGSKVQAWVQALPLVRGHLYLGVGRGAFENAFQGVSSVSASIRFIYLENEWLQALCDFGVPLSLLLLLLLGLSFRSVVQRLGSDHRKGHDAPLRVAAFVALCAVLLHNLVDFNLEAGGVALPLLALCAVLGRGRFRLPRGALLLLSLCTLSGAAGAYLLAPTHEEDGARLRHLAQDPAVPVQQVVKEGQRMVRRHPLDAYLSAVVAARLWQDRQLSALSWVNRALLGNRHEILALRIGAQVLAATGHRSQAAAMLHSAIPLGTYPQRLQLYRTVLQIARTPDEVLAALPDLPQVADEMLTQMATSQSPPWDWVRKVGEWGQGLHAPEALTWLGNAALAQHDVPAASRYGALLARSPTPPAFLLANIAALLLEAGRAEEAESLCQEALTRARSTDLDLSLALILERRGALEEARAALGAALTHAADPESRARAHDARADLETRQGNLHRAAEERVQASHLRSGAAMPAPGSRSSESSGAAMPAPGSRSSESSGAPP